MEDSDTKLIKLMLLGDDDVKTSLKKQYLKEAFSSNILHTLGCDISTKFLKIKNKAIKLIIYDTAGQNRFKLMITSNFKNCQIILFVYDVANNNSFEQFNYWIEDGKII